MTFSLDNTGQLTTTEARERELTGWQAGTIDLAYVIDDTDNLDDTDSITQLFHALGIHFTSPDGFISIFNDGSVEANSFIEGSRVSLDNASNLTVFFLREVE